MISLAIYGTLGPACKDENTLFDMFEAGMTGIRLNLSHVNLEDVQEWIENYHKAAKRAGIKPDLLIDMQGPELRIGKVNLDLEKNEIINIHEIDMPSHIYNAMKVGQEILLDDGKLKLQVIDDSLNCKVIQEGLLTSSKSIALPGVEMNLPTLTTRDIQNLVVAKQFGVTGLMQPFVRNKEDLINIKNILKEVGNEDIKVYAKIENQAGVDQIESLIPYCDEIIIARGDLGNSVSLPKLPSVQRYLENICKKNQMPYMVVTEMLYTMQQRPVPTRAEVSDIYNAVVNGASSIMLTGETAAGRYPVEAMRVFVECANVALKDRVCYNESRLDV